MPACSCYCPQQEGPAAQVAKALGARVIGGASGERKSLAARAAGADASVDLSQPGWRDRLKALAPGGTVDVVLDPLGGDYTEPAFRSLGWGGRHLMVGFAGGGIRALRGNLALLKGASLVGVDARQFAEREPAAAAAAANLAAVCALYAGGSIRPLVAAVHPFECWHAGEQSAAGRAGHPGPRLRLRQRCGGLGALSRQKLLAACTGSSPR